MSSGHANVDDLDLDSLLGTAPPPRGNVSHHAKGQKVRGQSQTTPSHDSTIFMSLALYAFKGYSR